MSNKQKTPPEVVEKMYQEYKAWKPVVAIAKSYGLTRYGVYWLFEQNNLKRNRREKMRGE